MLYEIMLMLYTYSKKYRKNPFFVTFQFNHKIINKLTGIRASIYSFHITIISLIFYHVTLLIMNYNP